VTGLTDATTGREPICGSLDELLAGATRREPFQPPDGKSAVPMERVVIGRERYVVKHLHADDDWIMRAIGDLTCLPVRVWESGLLRAMPDCIDHTIVAVAAGLGRHGWGGALLMRDVSAWLVPAGDDPISSELEAQFFDHMAAVHAELWGWQDTAALNPLAHRYTTFTAELVELETARAEPPVVPGIVATGWARFPTVAPTVADSILALQRAPWPLVDALAALPQTFVHGDWKLGNLGAGPDGRTILLDWATPGRAPAVCDLGWYLSINAARLAHGKDVAIDTYRAALERRGIDTREWWDHALDLALLGAMVQFGWEKALGERAELMWWVDRAVAGLARL
jgi:hypothetical protein